MISGDMRALYLLRHAKSSWDDPGLPDHDRPLAPRGRAATKPLAKHLQREGVSPQLVLCSSARRARETLEGLTPALGADVDVQIEPGLYGATPGDLIERLHAIPDDVDSAMLIGHNPTIQLLAQSLAARGEQLDEVSRKYPTGALATLTFDGSWGELGPGGAELLAFVRPKDLR
jgi:phosphohistidine phosphatase